MPNFVPLKGCNGIIRQLIFIDLKVKGLYRLRKYVNGTKLLYYMNVENFDIQAT